MLLSQALLAQMLWSEFSPPVAAWCSPASALAGESVAVKVAAADHQLKCSLDPAQVQEAAAQRRALQRVARAVEPEVLARHMLRPEDDAVRSTDVPERLQMDGITGAPNFIMDDCAQCVHPCSPV